MNLDEDLQRILNIGAKIYNTQNQKQGKVIDVNDRVHLEYLDNSRDIFDESEFKQMLIDDVIVSNSRLTMGSGNGFKVRPRAGRVPAQVHVDNKGKKWSGSEGQVQSLPKPNQSIQLETGYINEKTGKFSKTHKRGYVKIEYRKAVQKVELEVDDETLAKLKEMGLV